SAGRVPRQRTTTYGSPLPEQVRRSFGAAPLAEPLNPPARDAGLRRPAALLRPAALAAGVNDLGGTLMNESISRAAGSAWGQELPPEAMEALIRSAGRVPRQRTTTYGSPLPEQVRRSFGAAPLAEALNPPARDAGLRRPAALLRPAALAG
ncbi:MAG TPA: hypothetical protein VFX51_15985, partial [Solirubrobacteraceae bacterium]|nr:hypothetical protein [Solirubrobacteraceae bacterium]